MSRKTVLTMGPCLHGALPPSVSLTTRPVSTPTDMLGSGLRIFRLTWHVLRNVQCLKLPDALHQECHSIPNQCTCRPPSRFTPGTLRLDPLAARHANRKPLHNAEQQHQQMRVAHVEMQWMTKYRMLWLILNKSVGGLHACFAETRNQTCERQIQLPAGWASHWDPLASLHAKRKPLDNATQQRQQMRIAHAWTCCG